MPALFAAAGQRLYALVMDMQSQAVRQKTIGFWLMLGGMASAVFQTPALLGLGVIAFCWGLVLFIMGRMKQ